MEEVLLEFDLLPVVVFIDPIQLLSFAHDERFYVLNFSSSKVFYGHGVRSRLLSYFLTFMHFEHFVASQA